MSLPQRLYGAVRITLANRQFVVYVVIGVLTQAIDIGLFLLFVRGRLPVEVATTMSIGVATATHFLLNKYLNFRNHERHVGHQLRTYLTICAVSLGFQVGVVSVLSRVVLLTPFAAKLVGNALSFPMNFLMHRYFTFGRGIRGAVSAWLARPRPAAVHVTGRDEPAVEAPL